MRRRRARRAGTAVCAIVSLLLATACGMAEDAAKARVTMVLGGLSEAGGDSRNIATQTAVCQWAQGTMMIPDDLAMSVASDHFTRWANEKGIFRQFSSYEITGTETTKTVYGAEVIVSVKIEGRPLRIKVLKNAPLKWVD